MFCFVHGTVRSKMKRILARHLHNTATFLMNTVSFVFMIKTAIRKKNPNETSTSPGAIFLSHIQRTFVLHPDVVKSKIGKNITVLNKKYINPHTPNCFAFTFIIIPRYILSSDETSLIELFKLTKGGETDVVSYFDGRVLHSTRLFLRLCSSRERSVKSLSYT